MRIVLNVSVIFEGKLLMKKLILGILVSTSLFGGVALNHIKAGLSEDHCSGGFCMRIGIIYESGKGVPQNYSMAAKYYNKACEDEIPFGCAKLGIFYENGQGVSQDHFKAVELYTKSCASGVGGACTLLGYKYLYGQGVRQNSKKALDIFGLACDMKDQGGCSEYAKLRTKIY